MKYHVRKAFVVGVFLFGALTGRVLHAGADQAGPCNGLAKITTDPRAADPKVTLRWTCRPSADTPGRFEWHLEVR